MANPLVFSSVAQGTPLLWCEDCGTLVLVHGRAREAHARHHARLEEDHARLRALAADVERLLSWHPRMVALAQQRNSALPFRPPVVPPGGLGLL